MSFLKTRKLAVKSTFYYFNLNTKHCHKQGQQFQQRKPTRRDGSSGGVQLVRHGGYGAAAGGGCRRWACTALTVVFTPFFFYREWKVLGQAFIFRRMSMQKIENVDFCIA